ncbi:tyrosine/serine/threonine protein phosphatase [Ancistrocladus abbreviatus]
MVTALISNPNLSTPFLGHKFCIRENRKEPLKHGLSFKNPRCAVDTPYGGLITPGFSSLKFTFVKVHNWIVPLVILRLLFVPKVLKLFTPTGNVPQFPRMNVWDPYKRLGISNYASEEEIWGSRNFLLQQYGEDERSMESIETAFEKLLMKSFSERRKTKINLKTRLKKKVEESPPWVKNVLNFVELPPIVIILRRLFLFAFMAGWSIINSAESGPAFQVAISLAACIYFLNDKTKSLSRSFVIGFGSLVFGWVCGSCLGPTIPTMILPPTWTLELLTSLVVYFFLFLGCTFLK